jgi:hypothetical protein
MRLVEHVARTGEKTNAYMCMVEKPSRKRPLGIPTFRWEVKMNNEVEDTAWPEFIWLRIRTEVGSCEQSNGPSGSI